MTALWDFSIGVFGLWQQVVAQRGEGTGIWYQGREQCHRVVLFFSWGPRMGGLRPSALLCLECLPCLNVLETKEKTEGREKGTGVI